MAFQYIDLQSLFSAHKMHSQLLFFTMKWGEGRKSPKHLNSHSHKGIPGLFIYDLTCVCLFKLGAIHIPPKKNTNIVLRVFFFNFNPKKKAFRRSRVLDQKGKIKAYFIKWERTRRSPFLYSSYPLPSFSRCCDMEHGIGITKGAFLAKKKRSVSFDACSIFIIFLETESWICNRPISFLPLGFELVGESSSILSTIGGLFRDLSFDQVWGTAKSCRDRSTRRFVLSHFDSGFGTFDLSLEHHLWDHLVMMGESRKPGTKTFWTNLGL